MPLKSKERRLVYNQRKEQGLCPRCGIKLRRYEKFTFCEDCRAFFRGYTARLSESINEQRKNRYNQRKENNQCPRCGKKLGKRYPNIICQVCLGKQYQYNKN